MARSKEPMVRGFSLIEILIAMMIVLPVGLVIFQVFVHHERVFRDQSLIVEMQQNARAVASMIEDEIRMAGQGVPVYAATHEAAVSEATQTFLPGTDAANIRFRAGIRNGRAVVTDPPPVNYTIASSINVGVDNAQSIFSVVGNNAGRHIYLVGPGNKGWTWVRAEILDIPAGMNSLHLTPRQISGEGGLFRMSPGVSLEEAISYQLSNGSIRRGTSTTFTALEAPNFVQSAVGDDFVKLQFDYYDGVGVALDPTTLALRSIIRRVDFVLEAATSGPLSDGSKRTFAVSASVSPRNLEIH